MLQVSSAGAGGAALTLWPGLQVGEAGAWGLDVGGLEGRQDEGNLFAIVGHLGQEVVICDLASALVQSRA